IGQVDKPHDRFFKKSLEDLDLVKSFISNYLPEELVRLIDLDSLELAKGNFVSDDLKETFTDMLFSVKLNGQDAYLVFLFEHKSQAYADISLQLLGYMLNIWKSADRNAGGKLPVVIPLLIYHGRYAWNVGLRLYDLFSNIPNSLQEYVPDYKYLLFDLSRFSEEDIKGSIKAKLFLEVLRSIMHEGLVSERSVKILALISELDKEEGVVDYIKTVLLYMIDVRDDLTIEKLVEINREYKFGKEDLIMSVAEQLRKEGMQIGMKKGRQEALIKTARKALMKGMDVDDVVELTELPKDEVLKLMVEN
ncbi:Rpn family recombination-promoting nuclease/putative transposase, partial [Peptococcaceae bacterium]|nr:Rpn family recombination-promoting nuclease/putative transposase [Peptococcaceae bacterium]